LNFIIADLHLTSVVLKVEACSQHHIKCQKNLIDTKLCSDLYLDLTSLPKNNFLAVREAYWAEVR